MTHTLNEPEYYAHINTDEMKFFGVSAQAISKLNVRNIAISELAALQFLSGKEPLEKWQVTLDEETGIYDIVRDTTDEFNYLRIQLQEHQQINWSTEEDLDIALKVNEEQSTLEIHFKDFIIMKYPEIRFIFTREDNPIYFKGYFSLSKRTVDVLTLNNVSVSPIVLKVEDTSDLSVYTRTRNINIALTK